MLTRTTLVRLRLGRDLQLEEVVVSGAGFILPLT